MVIVPPVDQAPTATPAAVHSSTTAVFPGFPPVTANALEVLPALARLVLAVLKSFCSAQLVPFHNSVAADKGGAFPA